MARRLWLAALALTLVTALMVPAAAAERITVIMPRHEMDLVGLWEKQTREFEQETGVEVEFIQLSWDEVANKVLTDLAAGGGTYDVIEFDNGWVAKFAEAGWVEPLDPYASDAYLESLLPGLVGTFSRNGQVLGIPWNNDTRFFFYNARMLAEARIDAPPRTWDEVAVQARRLKEAGVVTYPIAEYWNQEWALGNSFAFYLYSFGADYFDETGKITIDKPQGVQALRFMVDMLRQEKLVHPSSVTLSQEAAADLFYQGQAAFLFQGPPVTYNYANDPQRSRVVGEVRAASWLPALDAQSRVTLTLPEAFAIPKSSRHKEAAWRYIQYMISQEKDRERAETLGSLPLFRSLYTDPQLLARYPYWKQFGEQSERARPLPQVEWYDELVQTTIVSVQRALLGLATPEQAAGEIAAFLDGQEVDGVGLTR
ncbi:ABC transporter substrate-binding protein [Limnochorda pilosa]|uniref:Extracellular solute-binding protein family 1 n=1 Tax=Limnochorda pilosa TaxID=1555112 RepID=A0A0K2SLB4_LIMPI|nr:sugar ABC transporter substrate-binding protein [Limnochorda pilosa]BAS27908.1 extracellular solute-binding protein family 1 [Limnochorda pilosa]